MRPERRRHFERMSFDELMKLCCDDFLVDEICELIANTPMTDDDKRLCKWFYIEKKSIAQTAVLASKSEDGIKKDKRRLHDKMMMSLIKTFFKYQDEED